MIVDAHYHLEEQLAPAGTLLEQMDRAGVGRIALIPATQAPFVTPAVAGTVGGIVRSMLNGRLRGGGLSFYRSMVTDDGQFNVLGSKYLIFDRPGNEKVAAVLGAHPDRFYGWIIVNPRTSDACAEVERWIGQPGWIGVKSHPFMHRYPVALLDDVAAYCSERGLPLLVHLGAEGERGDFRHLPDRHPRLKVVYAHAGVPAYGALWEYARDKPNVYVDLSNPIHVGPRERLNAVRTLGARRCLFGTDGPYIREELGQAIRSVREMSLSSEETEGVLGGSFLELIGR